MNDAQHTRWREDARANIARAAEYAENMPFEDPGQLIDIELTAAVVASNFSIAERIRNLTVTIDSASESTGVDLRQLLVQMQMIGQPKRKWFLPRWFDKWRSRRAFRRAIRDRKRERLEVDQRAAELDAEPRGADGPRT